MKLWVQKFNQFDLYTKDDNEKMDIVELPGWAEFHDK